MEPFAPPEVTPTMQDVVKVVSTLSSIRKATPPLMQSADVLRAILIDAAVRQHGIEPPSALTEPIPPGVIHSIHGAISELAAHCCELVMISQTILAAHDRLHENREKA